MLDPVIRVVIADDHTLVREGTRELLEQEEDIAVVGLARDGAEAVALVDRHRPDVALIDIAMPRMDGIAATREIGERFPRVAVLILTIHDDETYVVALLDAGAAGYLLKDVGRGELVDAVRAVHAGDAVLHPGVTRTVLERLRTGEEPPTPDPAGHPVITDRERQVLEAAASGASNKQIAQRLDVGTRTVQTHLANMFDKLGVASRTQAVIEGIRRGLIDIDHVA